MKVKCFKPLSMEKLATKTNDAVRSASYIDITNALSNIEETPSIREPLVTELRRLIDKSEPTKFESIFLMMVQVHLQAEIQDAGED